MKYFKIFSAVMLGILFLALALKNIDFRQAVSYIPGVRIPLLLAAVFSFFYTQFIRAGRWHILSGKSAKTFGDSFMIFFIGLFANFVFPFRIGEFSRPLVMKKVLSVPFSSTLGIVFAERVLDLAGQAFLIIFVLAFSPGVFEGRLAGYIKAALALAAAVSCAGFLTYMLISKKNRMAFFLRDKATRIAPGAVMKLSGVFETFRSGAGVFSDRSRLAAAFLYTLVSWFVSSVTIMFSLEAMNINLDSPFLSACFIQAAVSVALVIPPPPGFVGTFHYFCMEGLMFYSVTENRAAAYAFFFHALQIILISFPGACFMFYYGIGFSDMVKKEEAAKEKNIYERSEISV